VLRTKFDHQKQIGKKHHLKYGILNQNLRYGFFDGFEVVTETRILNDFLTFSCLSLLAGVFFKDAFH